MDEHVRGTESLMNVPEIDARTIFRRLDRDGDGALSTRELLEAIRESSFDDDATSAGGWLLGPLDRS